MNAFGQWMAMERCYRPEQLLNYGDLPMDYLLQTIVSGDEVSGSGIIELTCEF
jgi:hypothetical protein